MSYSLSISLYGEVKTKNALADLVDAVMKDDACDGQWMEYNFEINEKSKNYICNSGNEPLVFTSKHHREEGFLAIEAICMKHKLGFVRATDPDGNNQGDGSKYVYNPNIQEDQFMIPGYNLPVIAADTIKEIIENNEGTGLEAKLDKLATIVRNTTQPTYGLPAGFSVNERVTKVPSPKTDPAP